ncbi:SHOCT domain-containing protein [Nocardia coubleae]|uniref:SHOCT domain-containing protein n=1 Tax=Nocardia coubleae TaxID=356147 RepID=A0A846WE43_9NOCA|nr:SHOCT domain-containing protein [Nocardia coubleae]NKX90946.1 SHOCT domain-containing protein [Nocardia coubleae]
MTPQLAPKVKEKTAAQWMEALPPYLYPGELVWALARLNGLKPIMDGLAITNARVIGFAKHELRAGGDPAFQVDADTIAAFGIEKKFTGSVLTVTKRDRQVVKFPLLGNEEDNKFVAYFVDCLQKAGFPPAIREAITNAASDNPGNAPRGGWMHSHQRQVKESRRNEIVVIGAALKDVHWRAIDDHSGPDEVPWFILSCDADGLLAAFEDRLIIAKVGFNASMMAGSLGGGRITTFPYPGITNIEYNSGLLMGVLEVLTPSYQGSRNHDYWRSFLKNPNNTDNNPRALSNTIPVPRPLYDQALPQLNTLQSKISASKRPPASQSPSPPASLLAEEIQRLANLHAQGLLTDVEFTAAKQAAIRTHR